MNEDQERLNSGIQAYDRQDYAEAFRVLIDYANAGNPQAQCYIALMYQCGLGVQVDGKLAVELYTIVAEQEITDNHLSAISYQGLATIYATGLPNIDSDKELATKYRQHAIRLGIP